MKLRNPVVYRPQDDSRLGVLPQNRRNVLSSETRLPLRLMFRDKQKVLTCSSLSLRSCSSRCFRIFGFSRANFLISSRSRSYRILESISRGN